MGMITTVNLEPGLCFGPLPTDWMIADPAYLIAQTTTDQLPELPTVIVNPLQLSDPHRLIEWVCNLRSARYPGEQNVELIRDPTTGHSFYYIIRPIDAGQEMFVWFRRADINPLAERVLKQRLAVDAWLGLDEASDMTQAACDQTPGRVSASMQCELCNAEFRFIYPYIAHFLFKCGGHKLIREIQVHLDGQTSSHPNLLPRDTVCGHQPVIKPSDGNSPSLSWKLKTHLRLPETIKDVVRVPPVDVPGLSLIQNSSSSWYPQPNLPPEHQAGPVDGESVSATNSRMKNKAYEKPPRPIPKPNSVRCFGEQKTQRRLEANKLQKQLCGQYQNSQRNRKASCYPASSYPHKDSPFASRTRNPLVEQLLQTIIHRLNQPAAGKTALPLPSTSLRLAQNWCARCFTTFRLTSDLVQHMRTCHNKEQTGMRIRAPPPERCASGQPVAEENRRESMSTVDTYNSKATQQEQPPEARSRLEVADLTRTSLVCHLCGETFRERHHLTRHMTSHT
ncbi:hypothetical protein T265_03880 [Opisthorchis viverrini]|uniref:C2H2-type domain-containing protein n=1 Tax=Opisthorchis viverrini TaxID=6198 RepID=A0A075AH97_OPIVI|nr:hypothetical protein T265_03880 [Opisthorchis viverrini]KER29504.1 hypothetical protein T265_03880 [Opisthorchis viverrini]